MLRFRNLCKSYTYANGHPKCEVRNERSYNSTVAVVGVGGVGGVVAVVGVGGVVAVGGVWCAGGAVHLCPLFGWPQRLQM